MAYPLLKTTAVAGDARIAADGIRARGRPALSIVAAEEARALVGAGMGGGCCDVFGYLWGR